MENFLDIKVPGNLNVAVVGYIIYVKSEWLMTSEFTQNFPYLYVNIHIFGQRSNVGQPLPIIKLKSLIKLIKLMHMIIA